MIVQANWPGATVDEMTNQVTDRIERKLRSSATLDFTNSYTSPGQTTVFVNLHERRTPGPEIRGTWVQCATRSPTSRQSCRPGVQGPFFNDQFGDVYRNIYAFTADGLSFRQLRDYAEQARAEILKIPSAGKVDLIGTQDEVIYLDFSTQADRRPWPRPAGGDPKPAGAECGRAIGHGAGRARACESAGQRPVHASEDALRAVNLRVNDRFFRLADVATITPRLSPTRRSRCSASTASRRSASPSA